MEELKKLMAAYKTEVGEAPQLLGVALSARRNLCIHPEVKVHYVWRLCCGDDNDVIVCVWYQVSREVEGRKVDSKCHELTASFVRQRRSKDPRVPVCLYYEVNGVELYVE